VRAEVLRDYRRARQEYQAAVSIDAGFSEAATRVTVLNALPGIGPVGSPGSTPATALGSTPAGGSGSASAGGSGTTAGTAPAGTAGGAESVGSPGSTSGSPSVTTSPGLSDLSRVATLTVNGINAPTLPRIHSAADPAFRQRLFATIIIILSLP
jgi:hypothetical protein